MVRTDHSRRRILQASGVAIATALAGCGGGGSADDGGTNADITVTLGGDQGIDPRTVEVAVGETVSWQAIEGGGDFFIRNVTGPEDGWSGPGASAISGDQTHTHTFEVAGTYEYEVRGISGTGTVEVTE
ncbi:hypothetical protein GCM10028857_14690 [Salinarchaeum chitinilyticum]